MSYPSRKNSLRYDGLDYTSPAGIFVTLVTHDRQKLFGTVEGDQVALSQAGNQLSARWRQIPSRFPSVWIDAFAVMPDHIHGILLMGAAESDESPSTGDVVRWVKSSLMSDFKKGVTDLGWRPYDGRLWQRGYHDHIIRGDRDMNAIREYIGANPYKHNS